MQASERGTAKVMASAEPRAEHRTASSPRPSRQSAWAGRTASAVSASGTPRKVVGMLSRNECVIRAANIAAASASSPSAAANPAPVASRIEARVFAWIPGARPEAAPSRMPTRVPAASASITFSSEAPGIKAIDTV